MLMAAKKINSFFQKLSIDAEAYLSSKPLPSLKDENYKFTLVSNLPLEREMSFPSSDAPVQPFEIEGRGNLLNFRSVAAQVYDLTTADREASFLDSAEPSVAILDDYFAQLLLSKKRAGRVVQVFPGQIMRQSLTVKSYGEAFYFHNIFVVEPGADLELIEDFVSMDEESTFVLGLVQIILKPQAKANIIQLQNFNQKTNGFLRYDIQLMKDASCDQSILALGGQKLQTRIEVSCQEEGSSYLNKSAVYANETQHFDFWMSSNHLKPNTQANTELWAVADDSARVVFNGNIRISKNASKTEAHQLSKNLLVSSKASIESMPKLDIATDDVQVSHGASISNVEEEQLFYMQSRGLNRSEASQMIIDGFAGPVISRIEDETLQERAKQLWQAKEKEGELA